ncbi:MAG: formyltransferase family protein [Oscillospiraceae bacterium]
MKTKLLLFAATEKGCKTLRTLLEKCPETLAAVVSFRDKLVDKDYFDDIKALCDRYAVRFFVKTEFDKIESSFLDEAGVTLSILTGWRYLLPLSDYERRGIPVIIFHDSLLPRYRGFAPTATAIFCGENLLGMTALFADDEMDTGDIILQKSFKNDGEMNVAAAIHKLAELYAEAALEIIDLLEHGQLRATAQNHADATYSIWRDMRDCEINWNDSAEKIHNFVRAVGSPYPGAYTYGDVGKIVIRKTSVVTDIFFEDRAPGKLWKLEGGCPIVVCGEGMLKILSAEREDGSSADFTRLRVRLGSYRN